MQLSALPLRQPAAVQPVACLQEHDQTLAVPVNVAPSADDLLGHVLFALKHEGIHLGILMQALPLLPAAVFEAALSKSPNAMYLRKACFLREAFTGQLVKQAAPVKGAFVPLFDPRRYFTLPGERNSRWRVEFNGLGTLAYCATVERTPQIEAMLERDLLGRANILVESLAPFDAERLHDWAYLQETQASFAIEGEEPSEEQARRFVRLLRQAQERRPLDESYLVAIQNSTVSHSSAQATGFRQQQNYLTNQTQGPLGVAYVPPPAELCGELMEHLMRIANRAASQVDPLVVAAIVSFGLAFLHPFPDGNGRLSRFLLHQQLCHAEALQRGMLLPMSVAIQRDPGRYLASLQEFSRPARAFWELSRNGGGISSLTFKGPPAIYRYWDATPQVAFTLDVAQYALDALRDQAAYLKRFDAVYAEVNACCDVRGSDLAALVVLCLAHRGVITTPRRHQFQDRVPEAVFDCIERAVQRLPQQLQSQ
nr:Fic family protein [Pseudomonas sp. ZH-FAD]